MGIPVYSQIITEEDAKAVYEAVQSGFITQAGSCVAELEKVFSERFKRRAVSCSNGTTALHLAILALNLEGATIAIPSSVFAAVAFAPTYAGCQIEFIEMDNDTWNFDLDSLEDTCKRKRIDAVIAVHNYGNPYDYFGLKELSEKYKFYIIEDACEAIGSAYKGRMAGNMGDISVFSFFANKVITGAEGGIILADDEKVIDRIKLLRSQAVQRNPELTAKKYSQSDRFNHVEIGYNYRITNMQAALILSQFKRLDGTVGKCRKIARMYQEKLDNNFIFQKVLDGAVPNWWMTSVRLDTINGQFIMGKALDRYNIDSRPVFQDLRSMKPWGGSLNPGELYQRGITLPSGPGLTEEQMDRVCEALLMALGG